MRGLLSGVLGVFLLLSAAAAGGLVPPGPQAAKGGKMSFSLTSSAFAEGANIPARFTCEGQDLSPALAWSGHPEGTRSFALIVDDPDAPVGTFTHWVLFDVPPAVTRLDEGQKAGDTGRSGKNDFGRTGYGGPCPPRGRGPHRYYFTLHALDVAKLGVAANASRQAVEAKMQGHVLATAKLMGRYERK